MFNFFQSLFQNFMQRRSQPSAVTISFSNMSGKRISVAIDQTLPPQQQVDLLNKAAGDISWRVSPTGQPSYIVNENCPMKNRGMMR